MKDWQIIYNENKKLDKKFFDLYGNDIDYDKKNKIELLVEIGEMVNESRIFKYWSDKKVNYEALLMEYADCLMMILYFFNYFDISLDEEFNDIEDLSILDLIGKIYQLSSNFYSDSNRELIKEIAVYFNDLGYKLGLSREDIINTCLEKMKINFKRFEEGF